MGNQIWLQLTPEENQTKPNHKPKKWEKKEEKYLKVMHHQNSSCQSFLESF